MTSFPCSLLLTLLFGLTAPGAADLLDFDAAIEGVHVDLNTPERAVQFIYSYQGPMEMEDTQVSLDFVVWVAGCDRPLYGADDEGNDADTPPTVYTHSITQYPDEDLLLVNVALDFDRLREEKAVWTRSPDDTSASLAFCGRLEVHYGDNTPGKDRIFANFHETDFQATINLLLGMNQPRVEAVAYTAEGEFGQETFPLEGVSSSQAVGSDDYDHHDPATPTKLPSLTSTARIDSSTQDSSTGFSLNLLVILLVVGMVVVVIVGVIVTLVALQVVRAHRAQPTEEQGGTIRKKPLMKRFNTNDTTEPSESSTSSTDLETVVHEV